MSERAEPERIPGTAIVRFDLVGTAVFVISAVLAAVMFDDVTKGIAVGVSMILFTIGVCTFLWSWWTAVQRSRTDEMAVAELYLLTGPAIPGAVKRAMLGALVVQIVAALATAFARSSTDGKPGSTLAFGILVPMFGLGLNGLWASRHGTFGPRRAAAATVRDSDEEMEQNAPHG